MRFLLIALLSLGIFFRLAHLDHQVYWYDEAFTSLRAAGYTEAEIVQRFSNSGVVHAPDLQQYQHPSPDRSLKDTLRSLAIEDTQHPPLYYAIAHYWSRWVGSSIADFRLLAALFSLLSLPAVYWLGQELWIKTGASRSNLPVWMAVGLFAISPFQVAYGQESRQYSLWVTLTLVMTAALLRALRRQTCAAWAVYAVSVAAGLYTFLFTGFICLAHAIYVLFRPDSFSKWRFKQPWQTWLNFSIATLAGFSLFSPWAGILVGNFSQAHTVTQWTEYHQTIRELIRSWRNTIGAIFYDRGDTRPDQLIQLGLLLLILYAFYWLCRSTSRRIWLLLVSLTLVPVVPLMLADVIAGGMRSTVPRYFIPTIIGIQLTVAYLLGSHLSLPFPNHRWRWIAGILCSIGLIACLKSYQATTWWQKDHNQENIELAQFMRQSPQAILISDAETGDLLSLSHNLDAKTALFIRPRCFTCDRQPVRFDPALLQIAKNYPVAYLFHPRSSYEWQQSLPQDPNIQFELITFKSQEANNKLLWRIVNK